MSDWTSLSLNLRPISRLSDLSASYSAKGNSALNSLGVVYRTNRVGGVLIFCGVPNQAFFVVESHITGSDTVSLAID